MLNQLWQERYLSIPTAARLIQKTDSEARAVLERLVEGGLVEARGERAGRAYHLSAATYRQLDAEAAYARQRSFAPLQREQTVLQYVQANGRITRREVAESCQIGLYQATRLLKKLVREGKLAVYGVGKGTWYGLRS